jgi:mannose-6-phosphate isomerase-like protein (cupin superfamily)
MDRMARESRTVDRIRIARDWESRGFSCDLWTDPPGARWEDFVHDVDELLMVVDGGLEVEIEGRTTHPLPGQEIFIRARARHSVRNTGGSTSHWLYGYRR